jgi:hypothetical protein
VEWFPSADLDDSSKYSNRGIFLFALRTVVGKGSVSTVFAHGLVGPNLSANVRKFLTFGLLVFGLGGQYIGGKVNR